MQRRSNQRSTSQLSSTPRARDWLLWFGALAVVTATMLPFRDSLEKAYVALVYLLLVLGASARSGRRVGLTLSVTAFFSLNDAVRLHVTCLGQGFYRVTAAFGFMETPNVPQIMALSAEHGLQAAPSDTSYYLGHERLLPTGRSRMPRWRKHLFVFMSRNAISAAQFFGLPPNRVVELGAQIEF